MADGELPSGATPYSPITMNILRLCCILCLSGLLSLSLFAAQPRIVFHEIVNPGAGKLVHGGYYSYPVMSGDGRIVVYGVNRTDGQWDLFAINTDGTGQHPLGVFPGSNYRPAISYDGTLEPLGQLQVLGYLEKLATDRRNPSE